MVNKLRVGVIIPNQNSPAWIAKTLEDVRALPQVEWVIALIAAGDVQSSSLYKLHFQLDRLFFHPKFDAGQVNNAGQILSQIPMLTGIEENKSAQLQSLKLDVLLNLSVTDYPDYLLDWARCGVWTLRDGENRFAAGSPVGWRELLHKNPHTACAVEIARRNQPAQIVAHAVNPTDPLSFSRNQMDLFWKASVLIPRTLKRLASRGEKEFFAEAEPVNSNQQAGLPTALQTFKLAFKQIAAKLAKMIRKRTQLEQWSLMLKPGVNDASLTWEGFQRIVPPMDRLWADPFILEQDGHTYLFIEEVIYKQKRGSINCMELNEAGRIISNQIVLERPYHLSYPFIFEYQGKRYMIPETGGNRAVEVYHCTHFPDQWEFHKTLLQGAAAYDATLLEYEGRWWMFVTIAGQGKSTWDTLYLYYADSPLADDWTPHPDNPLILDVRSARMAGRFFSRNGSLFRPSQDSSLRYGHGLNLQRVVTLTPTEYAEVLEQKLEPPAQSDMLAVHTYNFSKNWTVMDMQIRRRK